MICSLFAIPLGGSLNARGIRDFQKRETVFTWIKKPILSFFKRHEVPLKV